MKTEAIVIVKNSGVEDDDFDTFEDDDRNSSVSIDFSKFNSPFNYHQLF